MTISGELTKRQLWTRRLLTGLVCLVFSGAGLWFFTYLIHAAQAHHFTMDKGTQIVAIACSPILGAMAFGLIVWSDGWAIVEFTCNENCFRFRKLRSAPETHLLTDVKSVQEVHGRGEELLGYSIFFQDGGEVFLSPRLPNVKVLADWLHTHRRPVSSQVA